MELLSAPDRPRGLGDQPKLGELLVLGQQVAALGDGREPALRAQRQVVQGHQPGRRSSSPGSSTGDLLVTRPSTTVRPAGTYRSGPNPPARSSSYSSRNRSAGTV